MPKLIALATLILTLALNCSDGSIFNPTNRYDELAAKTIGHWQSGTSTLSFSGNGDFTEAYDLHLYENNKLRVIQKGKFEIVDSVLILKTVSWSFSNQELVDQGLSIVPWYKEIKMLKDVMIVQPVMMFTKESGSVTELAGKWKMPKWAYHSTPDYKAAVCQEVYYDFSSPDSVRYGWVYLDPCPFPDPNFKTPYQYEPPFIDVHGPSIYDTLVKFKNNKMYWYSKLKPKTYRRIQGPTTF